MPESSDRIIDEKLLIALTVGAWISNSLLFRLLLKERAKRVNLERATVGLFEPALRTIEQESDSDPDN